jgi:hypothetical protein
MFKHLVPALVVLLLTLARVPLVYGQENTPRIPTTFELEVDPLAYLMKGYSVHAIFAPGHLRFDAGVYGLELPQGMRSNTGFSTRYGGYGLKVNYSFHGIKGLFVGVGGGYTTEEATHLESGTSAIGHTIGVGVQVGYRFFLMKDANGQHRGLYLAPWIGLDRNFHVDEVHFDGLDYTQRDWQPFPTVHIGYRF